MKDTNPKKHKSQIVHDELSIIQKMSVMLTQERDFDKLFAYILDAAREFTNAEGATIYMVDEDNDTLNFIKVFNERMGISLSSKDAKWIPVSLFDDNGKPNLSNLAALCYHKKKSFNFDDIYQQNVFDSSGTRLYDKRNNYRTRSIVAIPMVDHKENVIGVIQLINAQDSTGEVIPFASDAIASMEILYSIAAILLNNHKLVIDLQTSFDQFLNSIAWAIDRKSKHFSGHIARVSELTNSIAYAINDYHKNDSKFADMTFSEDELQEINIAGLMHDLGKIITPMHVLDKSAKLECIFDRMEIVKLRIEHLRTIIQLAEYEQKKIPVDMQKLNEYESFLQKINPGRVYLSEEDKILLEEIYNCRFSYNNKELYIISDDEFYNLSIRIGTLNKEDLEIIREHAYVTGQMLSQIRFPRYLANAPLYAEQHHEKLNGKGYPNGLEAPQIPLQSRIIALADVFEALTAVRPYKESKKLSETYSILQRMVDSYEIDEDLFKFAKKSGVFANYARKHLTKDQIDIDL